MNRDTRMVSHVLVGIVAFVVLAMLAHTAYLTTHKGAYMHPVGFQEWRFLLSSSFAQHMGNTLIMGACLLVMIPFSLCAVAGILALPSIPLRFAIWGALALPLCFGSSYITIGVTRLFADLLGTPELKRIPVAYALIMRDLPFIALIAILIDIRYRPSASRLFSLVATIGAFWAFARGFSIPLDLTFNIDIPSYSATVETLNQSAFRWGTSDGFTSTSALSDLISQIIAGILFAAMAIVGWRMLPVEPGDAIEPHKAPGSSAALAIPAILFMLAPIIAWLVDKPMFVNPPIPPMPTLATIVGGLCAIPLGLAMAMSMGRESRLALPCVAVLCVASGIALVCSPYILSLRLGIKNLVAISVFSFQPCAVALLVGLCLPVLDRMGCGIRERWMCALGAGLLVLAFTLGTNGAWSFLRGMYNDTYTIPQLQLLFARNAMGTDVAAFPAFSLLPLALGGTGIALMARSLRARPADVPVMQETGETA